MALLLQKLGSPRIIQGFVSPQSKFQLKVIKSETRRKLLYPPSPSDTIRRSFERPKCIQNISRNVTPVKKSWAVRRLSYDDDESLIKCKPKKDRRASSTSTPVEPCVDTPERAAVLSGHAENRNKWSILGKGSFGTVVRVQYQGRGVAMKILSKHNYVLNEMNALNLNHENIVRVLKVIWNSESCPVVLMERFGDINLQQLINNSDFDLNRERRINYARDIARALEYCHDSNVLHLDVKPKNILVDLFEESCKLCDFGSSMKIGEVVCYKLQTMNTVIYTDPKVLKGLTPTVKSDTYSYGITLWQMLSRETPFKGKHIDEIIYQVVACGVRPETSANTRECDAEYVQLYEQCCHPEPHERPLMSKVLSNLKR